jgi:hypothetical protein
MCQVNLCLFTNIGVLPRGLSGAIVRGSHETKQSAVPNGFRDTATGGAAITARFNVFIKGENPWSNHSLNSSPTSRFATKHAEDALSTAQKEAHDKIEARKQKARAAATTAVEKVNQEIKSAGDSAARDWYVPCGAAQMKHRSYG